MISSRRSSMIARRPRAPIRRRSACRAADSSASSVKDSSTCSSRNSFWYWRMMAFLGSTRMRIIISTSTGSMLTTTGTRPTNSGIIPYWSRSSGMAWRSRRDLSCSSRATRRSSRSSRAGSLRPGGKNREMSSPAPCVESSSRTKPTLGPDSVRPAMIRSRPSNVPPQMNRMSEVSIWMNSCCGCLRPPCGGTLATVPSRILSRACCTPSPDTSREMEGLAPVLRPILSISSM